MTKEEKLVVIDSLAEQLNEYPHFYITIIDVYGKLRIFVDL